MIESSGAAAATTAETQTPQGLSTRPNERLRAARRSRRSPSGSGRVLSRQELADGCNEILEAKYARAGHARRWAGMTALYIGALERGEVRWPNQDYRAALRAFFNVTDIELGFYIDRPERLPVAATTGALSEDGEVHAAHERIGAR
jgi:hypothetical protein